MTLALAGTRRDAGVSVAEVNLKLIWDVVSGDQGRRARAGLCGRRPGPADRAPRHQPGAAQHRHDAARRRCRRRARPAPARAASRCRRRTDVRGRQVLTAYAPVTPLGWLVFVELPIDEAYAPLYRVDQALGAGCCCSAWRWRFSPASSWRAAWWCRSRRCARAPRASARRSRASASRSRPATSSKALADQFNDMAGKLRGILRRPRAEGRGAHRASWPQSVGELRALGEVSQAVNSTLDLETVLDTIVAKAVQLSGTDAGAIYVFDEAQQRIPAARHLRHERGPDRGDQGPPHRHRRRRSGRRPRSACRSRSPTCATSRPSPVNDIILRAGYRALLVVPLLGADRIVGALVVRRKAPGEFPKQHDRPAADLRRAVGAGDPERAAVQRDRARRAASSRSRASTSRSSSPT